MEKYLIHHGVKGQRWGVRKEEDEKQKSSKSKSKQPSKEELAQKKKIGKAIVISSVATLGAVAVTAAAVKIAPRVVELGQFISSGYQYIRLVTS